MRLPTRRTKHLPKYNDCGGIALDADRTAISLSVWAFELMLVSCISNWARISLRAFCVIVGGMLVFLVGIWTGSS